MSRVAASAWDMEDIWPQLKNWFAAGERFALATVVEASKPSPRGIGASLAIHEDGVRFIGSVSAGCVENEVIEAAKACLADGAPRWLQFGPGEGFPWEVSLSCGGKLTVRVEAAPSVVEQGGEAAGALVEAMERHERGVLLSGDAAHLYLAADGRTVGPAEAFPAAAVEEGKRRVEGQAEVVELKIEGQRYLYRKIGSRQRLFVIGASHIALHLAGVAKLLQYEVVVVEPRGAYGRTERFLAAPDALWVEWPTAALDRYQLEAADALVAVTHDPKIDDQALEAALRSSCGYIGALGSRKSHAARLRRLAISGFGESDLRRIHGPVGLDINSRTPAEIAISIVAELIRWRNGGGRDRAQTGG